MICLPINAYELTVRRCGSLPKNAFIGFLWNKRLARRIHPAGANRHASPWTYSITEFTRSFGVATRRAVIKASKNGWREKLTYARSYVYVTCKQLFLYRQLSHVTFTDLKLRCILKKQIVERLTPTVNNLTIWGTTAETALKWKLISSPNRIAGAMAENEEICRCNHFIWRLGRNHNNMYEVNITFLNEYYTLKSNYIILYDISPSWEEA